jgi:hypothetical protein
VRLAVVALLLVAGLVAAAYLVVPGPVNRSFLKASLERETSSGAEVLGSSRGNCRHVRGPRWRCRVQGRRGKRLVAYSVRVRDHACWTARSGKGRKPVEGCIHLLEPRIL